MDSAPRIVASFSDAIQAMGLPPRSDPAIRETIGLGLPEAIALLFPEASANTRETLRTQYRDHYLAPHHPPIPLFPGAREAIAQLHAAGYPLAVATGKSRKGLDRALGESGLGDYFAITRTADETRSKPDPLMLHEILAFFQVDAAKVIMVGDSEYDLEMAARAGCAAIAVSYGVHDCDRLLPHQPLACLDSLRELPDWLATQW